MQKILLDRMALTPQFGIANVKTSELFYLYNAISLECMYNEVITCCLECISCAVFLSILLMVSIIHLLRSMSFPYEHKFILHVCPDGK